MGSITGKKVTPKQQQKFSAAKCKNSRKVLTHDTGANETECSSTWHITVLVQTKKDPVPAGKKLIYPSRYLNSNKNNEMDLTIGQQRIQFHQNLIWFAILLSFGLVSAMNTC